MPYFLNSSDSDCLDLADHAAVAFENPRQPLGDRAIGFGIDIAEGQFFQFLAHALHAHAAGERRIDFHRLLGDAQALVLRHMVERAHVVETVGELDQEDAHVLRDGQQQLAQILRLLRLPGNEIELLQLGQALDELAKFGTEQFVDFLPGRRGVLDRVMEKGDSDRRLVHVHVGEDGRDFERVREIGIARSAPLMAMLLHRIDISLVEQRLVHVGLVALNALDKLILTHHWRIPERLKRNMRRTNVRRMS